MTLFLSFAKPVFVQVAVLFIMMAVGFILRKMKKVDEKGIKQMTTVLLTFVTPAVIIKAFANVEYTADTFRVLLWSALAATLTHLVGLGMGYLFFNRTEKPMRRILRYGIIFSNCGFMGVPLASAIFGDSGVFCISVYIVVFNLLTWTLGIAVMGEKVNLKKAIINPGVIGFSIAILIYFLRINLPAIVIEPIKHFAGMNAPLAMVVTGAILGGVALMPTKKDLPLLLANAVRLIFIPVICAAALIAIDFPKEILVMMILPMSAPCASNTSLFAVMLGADEVSASRLVAFSNVLCLITMPIISALLSMYYA